MCVSMCVCVCICVRDFNIYILVLFIIIYISNFNFKYIYIYILLPIERNCNTHPSTPVLNILVINKYIECPSLPARLPSPPALPPDSLRPT